MPTLTVDQFIEQYGVKAVMRAAIVACEATAHHVANTLKVYPSATESNRPGRWTHPAEGGGSPRPMGYYERNRGYWSPRMNIQRGSFGHFGKSVGRIKAKRSSAVAGYVLTSSSEMLGKKWVVRRTPNGALLTNSASYARVVQDKDRQAAIHKEHGWGTIQDAIAKAHAENVMGDAFMQALEKK